MINIKIKENSKEGESMKIAYYSNAKIPSTEANSIHIMKMCQAFSKLGHDVVLIVPSYHSDMGVDPFSYYGVDHCFKIKVIDFKNIKGKTFLYAYKAAKYINEFNPDFAYGRNINICFFLAMMKKINFSYEIHQPISSMGKIQKKFFSYIIKSKKLNKIVVISNALKKILCEQHKIDKNKIIIAHDGADLFQDKGKIVNLKETNNSNLNVGYIGQLYPGKGMEIICPLAKLRQDVNFHIIGGNDADINYWKSQIGELSNIFFYGYIPNSDVLYYGKKMDIMLAPYSNKVFGANSIQNEKFNLVNWMSPLKIFEYMSIEKPILCSNLPVLREILINQRTAILCDPSNIEEWNQQLCWCNKNREKIKNIGKNAKTLFEFKYTWLKRAKYLIEEISKNL